MIATSKRNNTDQSKSLRVDVAERISSGVKKPVISALQTNRIGLNVPAPDSRVISPEVVVIKLALFVRILHPSLLFGANYFHRESVFVREILDAFLFTLKDFSFSNVTGGKEVTD